MKFYGYAKVGTSNPIELKEVTVSGNPEALRQLANFINKCADKIEEKKHNFNHEHIDWKGIKTGKQTPDFIVHNPGSRS